MTSLERVIKALIFERAKSRCRLAKIL